MHGDHLVTVRFELVWSFEKQHTGPKNWAHSKILPTISTVYCQVRKPMPRSLDYRPPYVLSVGGFQYLAQLFIPRPPATANLSGISSKVSGRIANQIGQRYFVLWYARPLFTGTECPQRNVIRLKKNLSAKWTAEFPSHSNFVGMDEIPNWKSCFHVSSHTMGSR